MKKVNFKQFTIIIFVLIVLTGCGNKPEKVYSKAISQLNAGEYAEAMEKFDSISSFSDASKYSQYAKALQAAGNNDLKSAIATFESLGDFADASFYKKYYEAKRLKEEGDPADLVQAIELFKSIPLFLDSAEQADAAISNIAKKAEAEYDAGNYSEAESVYNMLLACDSANADGHIALANISLQNDTLNALDAIEILRNGIQNGADESVLSARIKYIQDNMYLARIEYYDGSNEDEEPQYKSYDDLDEHGNPIYTESTTGDAFHLKNEYDERGNLIYREESDGDWTRYQYDEAGNIIHEETSDSAWYSYEYDDHGNLIFQEDSWENWYGYDNEYDAQGKLIHSIMTGGEWEKEPGRNGKKVYHTEPGYCHNFDYEYDENGLLLSKYAGTEYQQIYEYDEYGNKTKYSYWYNNYDFLTTYIYKNRYRFTGDI